MRSFSNITLKFANKLHLLVDSLLFQTLHLNLQINCTCWLTLYPRIYALDRIKYLHASDETFVMPKDWTAEKFFDGCFGIIAEQSVKIQPVKLKVSAGQANYIRDLKMHESQKEIERNEEYSIFTFNLRPEFDFQQELLWNGEDMEVLEPLWLRKEIAGKIKRMWNKYEGDSV